MVTDEKSSTDQRLLKRLQEQRRAIEALGRIGPEASSPDRILKYAVAQVSHVTGIDHIKVMRYRPERGDLLVEAGVGWKPGVVGTATMGADYSSPAGRSVLTGVPVIIANILESDEYRYPDLLRKHNVISLLNVPVRIDGKIWGVLEADSVDAHEFDEWDVSFLTATANVMGLCVAQCTAKQKITDASVEIARQRSDFDTLIQELQHRTKNNLQMIVSFITLQTRELPPEVRDRFREVVGRVQAVALAQDMLTTSKKVGSVDFDDYLRTLCANIMPRGPDIVIKVDAQRVSVPIDRAVPAGMVVNELVTNCIKYAFGDNCGHISIRLEPIRNSSEVRISVEDDGKGIEIPPKRGLGLTLVERLAEQIQGSVTYLKTNRGSKTVFCFPVPV
jgi:two-component sensor histidine kinase